MSIPYAYVISRDCGPGGVTFGGCCSGGESGLGRSSSLEMVSYEGMVVVCFSGAWLFTGYGCELPSSRRRPSNVLSKGT